MYQHYRAVAESVHLPIILYNVPGRTQCDLLPQTVSRLANIANIVGIKDATGDLERLKQLLNLDGSNAIDVFSGDDTTAAEWMLAGAKGVISVTANIAPRLIQDLAQYALAAERESCLALDSQLQPLHQILFVESNPIPVKWAAFKMGLVNDEIRAPMTRLSLEHRQNLEQILVQLNLMRTT